MEVGTSEAEPIWAEFLRKLTRWGLRGVKLVVSHAHEGIKAAVAKVFNATWQRCRASTGEPYAGKPPVRLGGRGGETPSRPLFVRDAGKLRRLCG
jgi:Transposase, Mutator family